MPAGFKKILLILECVLSACLSYMKENGKLSTH